jgi:tripartite-type tricarboxylate transporter receptor subunit TctC
MPKAVNIKVLKSQEIRAWLLPLVVEAVTGAPQALGQLIRDDYARWGKIIRAAGIESD